MILLTCLLSFNAFTEEEGSPFTDIQFHASPSVLVEVDEEIYYLLEINGARRADIIQKCEKAYGDDCQFMLAEKFKETLRTVDIEIENSVNLKLYKMEGHVVLTKDNVPVTAENLDQIIFKRELRNER